VVRNNTINSQLTTSNSEPNNHNGNLNNNNSGRSEKSLGDTSLEEDISPWLVKDSVLTNKRNDKSRIPLLKTVITTEL
jgi:hypothetical protein